MLAEDYNTQLTDVKYPITQQTEAFLNGKLRRILHRKLRLLFPG